MKSIHFHDKNLQADVESVGIVKHVSANTVIMQPGDLIENIPLVVKGTIRIVLQNDEGDEHYLYHVFPGETCAMSLSCCQANKKSEIKAIIEDDADLLMIPIKYVDLWNQYPEWKKFVSDTQSQRFTELLETIELIAFSKLDEQLWNYLVKRAQATGNNLLKITHHEIAQELNSPREVITRLLHQLQKKGKIEMARGEVLVKNVV